MYKKTLKLFVTYMLIMSSQAYSADASISRELNSKYNSYISNYDKNNSEIVYDGFSIPGVKKLSIAASLLMGNQDQLSVFRGSAEASIFQKGALATVVIATDDGMGSGVIISNDGYILTNKHVVGNEKYVEVFFKPIGSSIDTKNIQSKLGQVYKYNDYSDLALVKVTSIPGYITPIQIESKSIPNVGDDAHAIGHPKGEIWSYTRGYVSQVRSDYTWKTSDKSITYQASVIQTQTPINPGNSGGPLLDKNGRLIGINSFGNPSAPGMNYAVSSAEIVKFLAQEGSKVAASPNEVSKCRVTELSKDRENDKDWGMTTVSNIDSDCNGSVDILMAVPDNKKFGIMYIIEDEESSSAIIAFDADRDGYPEITLMDVDGDGEFDYSGENKAGEYLASDMKPIK
jgi:S1-C subfamily serine protease